MADFSVLKFGATWCAPCKVLNPKLDSLMAKFPDIEFYKLDVDSDKAEREQYKIASVPTVILLKDGVEVNRLSGVTLITPLRSALKELK